MSAPCESALPLCLKASDVPHHSVMVTANHVTSPHGLEPGHSVEHLGLPLVGLVAHVPAFEELQVSCGVRLGLAHVPHPLALLDDLGSLQLLLDALSRDDTTDVLLQQCDGFLFVRLRHNVRRVVCNHIVAEVVVVAFSSGSKSRRLQTLQKPVLLRSLQQGCLEGVGMEKQPGVSTSGAVPVGLVVSRQEAAAHGEADVQQRQVVVHSGGLGCRQIPAARDGRRPVLLSACRLVR
mmetsp:Transcript_57360/g.136533  ORF Transcript_57360/g.136533 Transcript_57360/m.136533 type:complete len:236 (+) Transcript_57360:145-852(+)